MVIAVDSEWPDEHEPLPEEVIQVAGIGGIIWMCMHCEAWMEMLEDDDEEETDLDEAWDTARKYNK